MHNDLRMPSTRRSAVPGRPHIFCVRGVRGYKEIGKNQRWGENDRRWRFPRSMTHIVSFTWEVGLSWRDVAFGFRPGQFHTIQNNSGSGLVRPVCPSSFYKVLTEMELILEEFGSPAWDVVLVPPPSSWRCFGALLYDCTDFHGILNELYLWDTVSVHTVAFLTSWLKGCIMIYFLNVIIIIKMILSFKYLYFEHFWLEVCGSIWIMPFCIPESEFCFIFIAFKNAVSLCSPKPWINVSLVKQPLKIMLGSCVDYNTFDRLNGHVFYLANSCRIHFIMRYFTSIENSLWS